MGGLMLLRTVSRDFVDDVGQTRRQCLFLPLPGAHYLIPNQAPSCSHSSGGLKTLFLVKVEVDADKSCLVEALES